MAFRTGSGFTVIARSLSRVLGALRARSPACAKSISSCAARLTCTRADMVVIEGARGGGVGVTTFSGGGPLSWGGGARVTIFSGGGPLSWGGGAGEMTFGDAASPSAPTDRTLTLSELRRVAPWDTNSWTAIADP